MVPPKTNISHYRGDSMTLQFKVWADAEHTTPADLSEATVCMQVRETPDSTEAAATFDTVIDGGTITASLSPKSSRDLPAKAVWDCQIDWYSDDTNVQTIAGGGLVVAPDVSRDCSP